MLQKKCIFALFSLIVTLIFITGCFSSKKNTHSFNPEDVIMDEDRITVSLNPDTPHEDCFMVNKGQNIDYSFTAGYPVNFNLHYHVRKDVFYPVKKDEIKTFKSSLQVEKTQIYCLMWTYTGLEPTELAYVYNINN